MKEIILAFIVAGTLIGGAIFFTGGGGNVGPSMNLNNVKNVNNVSIVNGVQIVEIRAKGGYQPRKSVAKAGIPTILRFNTAGTFDCSSSVRIPSMNISKSLPQSGSTDITVGEGKIGTLRGSCGMGMYPFEVEFSII